MPDPDGRLVLLLMVCGEEEPELLDGGTAKHWGQDWILSAQKAIGDNNARFTMDHLIGQESGGNVKN
jgi:hypothetical protein